MKPGIHTQSSFLTIRMTDGSIYFTTMLLLPGERPSVHPTSRPSVLPTSRPLVLPTLKRTSTATSLVEHPDLLAFLSNSHFARYPFKLAQDPKTHSTWSMGLLLRSLRSPLLRKS